ncbi:Gfo/Idh/MocA family oxidoreductase [Natronorarus salvus]|uniref:Gfo/Idh/MocA family oxidoreductase n=1 Tax=Natronorarus salvus TaxID=3117733 RepID=UPI002F26BB20
MSNQETTRAGVIGVGSMGHNHARVYQELSNTELVGVADADMERAGAVAEAFETEAYTMSDLLERVEVVSIAVPTQYHYDVARECIDAGVHVLIEKPFVDDLATGRKLIEFAEDRGVVLQVGHIERFNPAVDTLMEFIPDLDVLAIEARRMGPPLDRDIDDSVVMDLMIHDIDVLLAILGDDDLASIEALGREDGDYATAICRSEAGTIGQLTASRVTQKKIRELTISAESCRIHVDYIGQSIEITRGSLPEYIRQQRTVFDYRHENVVEQVLIDRQEPLKSEISSFVEAVVTGGEPIVTGEDGLRAIEVAREIDRLATGRPSRIEELAE